MKDEYFIGQIFPQNCGDDLRVISKSDKKQGNNYLWKCEFIKYPCIIFAIKCNILNKQINNPEIENQTFIGKEFLQNCGDSLVVLEKSNLKTNKGESLYKCIFKIKNYEVYSQKYIILKGNVLNPYISNIFNIGYVGIGKYKPSNYLNIFHCWYNILSRCYNIKDLRYNIYGAKGITVCEEWLNFQNFAIWYEKNSEWNVNNYNFQIDKDILANINHLDIKVYSPETCLLIPADSNCFLAGDNLNCGISFYKHKNNNIVYYSRFKKIFLGTFNSFKEAKKVYAKEKFKFWNEEINRFDLPNDLREILLKYDFSWSWLLK